VAQTTGFNEFVDVHYFTGPPWKHPCRMLLIDCIDTTQIPDFCREDVVAVLMTNKVCGQRRKVVICSTHLPYDPAYSSASK
jgi:hypothetical protein